jgi:hypothetical protein
MERIRWFTVMVAGGRNLPWFSRCDTFELAKKVRSMSLEDQLATHLFGPVEPQE